MALTDAQAKIIAQNKKKKEEEEARKLAAAMLVNAAKPKASSFPTVTPSKVVTNQVTTPLKEGKPVTKRNTTTKGSSILSDMMGSYGLLSKNTNDRGQLHSPLDILRDRHGIGDTAQTLAYRARQYSNDDWQEKLQQAAERRVKRQEELAKYTLSESDLQLPAFRQQMVREAKDAWQKAKDAGDLSGMSRAHDKAENVRSWAGYSGGAAGDEHIEAQLTQKDRRTLTEAGQNRLKKALLDRQKAIQAGDLQAQMKASEKIVAIRNDPASQRQPTVGKESLDAHGRSVERDRMTAEGFKDAEHRLQEGLYSTMAAVPGSVLSFLETTNQAIDNDMVEKNRAYLQEKANQLYEYQVKLEMVRNGEGSPEWGSESWLEQQVRIAQNAQRLLTQGTIVDPNLPGQTLMRESQAAGAEALEGVEGWKRDLAEAAMSMGQMIPSVALSMIPGVGPALGLGLMGTQAAGSRAWELNEQNSQANYLANLKGGDPEDYGAVDPAHSSFRGLLSGIVEAGTGFIPMGKLTKLLKGKGGTNLVRNILEQMGMEGVEEGVAYTANFLLDKAAQDPNAEWTPEELWHNVKLGALAGGMMAAPAQIIGSGLPVSQPQERTVESVLRNQAEEPAQEQIPSEAKASDNEVRAEARTAQEAAEESVEAPRGQEATNPPETRMAQPVQAREARAEAPAVQSRVVAEMAETLGTSGSKAMRAAWDGQGSQERYVSDFVQVYNQARAGAAENKIRPPASLNMAQVMAAYSAGQNDRVSDAETAKVIASEVETEYTVPTRNIETEAETYGGEEVHLRDGGQWSGSAYTGGPVPAVEGRARQNQSRTVQRGPADAGSSALRYGRQVSTASLGIRGGDKNANIRLVKGGETEATKAAKTLARERGLQLTLFAGDNLKIRQADGSVASARGMFVSGKRVFVRVDHPLYTADQLMRHEAGHDAIAKGEVDIQAVKTRLSEQYGKEYADGVSKMYEEAYRGSGLSADEVWEEAICDSLGDMNVFAGTEAADAVADFLPRVKQATKDAERRSGDTRGPPEDHDAKLSRENGYKKVSQQAWRQIQRERMSRYGEHFDTMPHIDAIHAHDTLFVVENFDETHFGVVETIDPEKQQEKANLVWEVVKNGNIEYAEDYRRRLENLRSWQRRNARNSVSAKDPGAGGENAGASTQYEDSRDGGTAAGESSGADPVKFSRELENVESLREENALLQERVEYWKGQTKRTQRVTTDKKSVAKTARDLVERYGADIDAADIQADLQSLYDYLASGSEGGNDLTYEAARERAVSVAEKLVNNAVARDDEMYRQYSDLRKFLKETKLTVTESDGKAITDYADFRRNNLKYFKLSKADHTNVDQVYKEMSERWPEFFDEVSENNISDQLQHISDVMADVYNITEYNPFGAYTWQAVSGAANEIMEQFFDLPQTRATFADRQAAQLAKEKARGKQKLQEEREKKNAQLEKLRRENRERVSKAIQTERDRRNKELAKVKAKHKAKDEAGRDRRKARELRAKITRHANALRKKLVSPSDNQHIPEKLRTSVAAVLNAINQESSFDYGTDGRVARGRGTPTKRTQAFQELRLAYEKILSEADQQMVIDPDLMTNIQEMEALKDTPIGDLTVSQLTTMWNTIRAVEASITSYNKLFGQQKFETIREVAEGLKADNAGKRDRGDYRGPIGAMDKLLNAGMLTPESYFHRLGKTGESIFRMLRNAQDKHIGLMQEAQKYTEMVVKDVDVRKLEKETHTFDVEGQQVTMTTAQIMSLYELMKRQQAVDHVVEGGIRVEAVSKGLKKKGMSEAVRVSPEKVGEILEVLTPKQIEIADGLQKFMGDRLSQLGNEASMEVYGYEKFKEKNYFPIKVDSNQTISDQAKDAVSATIAGRGFTKGTKPHANNALMVRNIFDVYADHVTDMATYSSWLAPMENLQRIFNFKFRDEEGNLTGTVKGLIHRIYGQNGEAYWKKLTEDLNNGVKGVNDNPFQALIGNYKASAIGANIRVFIQQPTSILRALDSISMADFMAGITKANPNTWKKVKEYAPIAVWKDWGYFDADTGRQMKSILFGDDSGIAKVNNALMAPAGAMDSLAWSHIWNALEVETARKHKNLQKGSDAFYKKVAERFNEVVDHTQVVDGILQRSQVMRSPDGVTKMATSFMAEPTKIFNMFTTAAYDMRKSQDNAFRKKARKTMARTSVALFISFVANAAAQSLVDAFRDDDKDEEYWEKFFQAFVGLEGDEETKMDKAKSIASGNMGKALNPFGYLPFVKDVVSLVEGYDVSRMDMESISNVVLAVGNCIKSLNGEGKMTPANALLNLAAELSRFLGTPVSNIKRDVMAGINTWLNLTDNYKGQYAVAKVLYDVNYSGNKGMFLDIAYLAWRDGDKETFVQISQDLMDAFPDDVNGQTIESAMKSRTEKQMEADPEYQPTQTLEDLIGILPEYAEEEEKEEEFSAKNLNAEEYNRFMQQRADSYRKYEDAVTGSSVWGEMDDKAKDKVVSQLWKYAAQTALEDISGGKFVMDESSMVKAKSLEENHQIDPGTFFTLYGMTSVIKSDKNVDGEEISDSAAYKKLLAVRESGLLDSYTDEQQTAVYGALEISGKLRSMSEDALADIAAKIEAEKNAPSFYADFPEEKREEVEGILETLGSFTTEYDSKGKQISGKGKQDKIKAEIYTHYNSGEYTAHQCYLLFHRFYDSDKNNPWAYAKNG